MWNLDLEKLEKRFGPLGEIAVETGTCRGNGTRALTKKFPQVISIELDRNLHSFAAARLADTHAQLILGSSSEELAKILPSFQATPTFFFLDAHWSGDSSVDWEKSTWKGYGVDTAHGGKGLPSSLDQCPLLEELESIMKHCKGSARVLIDDMKAVGAKDQGFPGEDWTHLSREKLLRAVEPRLLAKHELTNPDQWFLELAPLC